MGGISKTVLMFLFLAGRNAANAFVGEGQTPSSSRRAFLPGLGRTTSTTSTTTRIFSDIPRMDEEEEEEGKKTTAKTNDAGSSSKLLVLLIEDWKLKYLPPPPEDQFIMTGDIAVLAFYAFTSHVINNWVVESTLHNSLTIQDALSTLDPLGDTIRTQSPVWIDQSLSPQIMDTIITMDINEKFGTHWGPMYSTTGLAFLAISTSWLLCGYFHQAFLLKNSIDCSTTKTLWKTVETWVSTAIFMCILTMVSNTVVTNTPQLQEWLGCTNCWQQHGHTYYLTKDDAMFIIDSSTVLITWRFMASVVVNLFR